MIRAALTGTLVAATLALAACGAPPKGGYGSTQMMARLWGGSEVPANSTGGAGTVDARLDRSTNMLNWTINYTGLTGPATAAHFHGPAGPGTNAGPTVPITGGLTSPIIGSAQLTPQQAADLQAGRWYFNIHTGAFPDGEIRGQVLAQL
jgi:hypothetical protein